MFIKSNVVLIDCGAVENFALIKGCSQQSMQAGCCLFSLNALTNSSLIGSLNTDSTDLFLIFKSNGFPIQQGLISPSASIAICVNGNAQKLLFGFNNQSLVLSITV